MAKLYWRVKRAGKWTWVAASADNTQWVGYCRTETREVLQEFQFMEEEE